VLHQQASKKIDSFDLAFEMKFIDPEEEEIEFDPFEIQDAFFEFMSSLLKHYPKYFVNSRRIAIINRLRLKEKWMK